MSEEDNIKAGIIAVKSGDLPRAASLFAQVVKTNPSSERGWFLLGMSCATLEQREYCLRRVLAINPNHADARKQLAGLSKPAASTPPPAWASQQPVPPLNVPKPTVPVTSPANYKDEPDHIEKKSTQQPKKAKPQKKKSNTVLVASIVAVPLLIICGLGIAYLFVSTQMPRLTPPGTPAMPTRVAQFSQLTLDATITPSPIPPTVLPNPLPTVAYTPTFENASCDFDTPNGADVNCGYVIVPEDRTGNPSDTIRLAVAIFHSTSRNPEAEPVMFLQGGPGAEAVQLSANAYDFLVSPFLSKRDFITFDQRGTGLSEPVLNCDELKKIYSQDIHGLIPATTRNLVYSNAFLSCNGLMGAQGVNLNAYSTIESAADVKDILKVLGYQKVNLYGASYGTRLAQVVMREYPEIVQSAILDSVVPIETNIFNKYPDSSESALKALFDTCKSDPECNAAYPDLETVFWEIVAKLDTDPVTVTTSTYPVGTVTESVTGSTFMGVVLGSIKSSTFINTAPQTIYRFEMGDYSTLISAQYSLPFAFESISPGLYISMMCHEHILTTTLEELQSIATRRGVKDYGWLPFYGDADDIFKTCKSWGAKGPFLGENDPVVSDIPSLIITGKYDPVTPPIYGLQISENLSNSYYFEFSNLGHTPTAADASGCAMDIAIEFLNDPTVEPDRTCMSDLERVDFLVPYTGDPEISMQKERIMGVSVDAPEDWFNLGDGFFFRGSSSLDITQVGLIQARLSAEELKDWFSLGAYGYRGLDTAPVSTGRRDSNGLTWTLYTSTSNGRPVDIAMADYQGNSLVVMLFSHIDEHEALYRTVFLPMIDSAK